MVLDKVPWLGATNLGQFSWQQIEKMEGRVCSFPIEDLSRYKVPAQLGEEADPTQQLRLIQQMIAR